MPSHLDPVATSTSRNALPSLALRLVPVLFLGLGPASTEAYPLQFGERTEIQGVYDGLELLYFGEDVSTFLGAPNANFQKTEEAEIGDVNGDGFPDIVEVNRSAFPIAESLILRMNTGAGGFQAIPLGVAPIEALDVDLADLDGDALPDLIIAAFSPRQVSVHLNLGEGGGWFDLSTPDFSAPMPDCPTDVAVGDLDGDGALDFAVSQRVEMFPPLCADQGGSARTSLFLNDLAGASGSFSQVELAPGVSEYTNEVFLLDADGDGDTDVVNVSQSPGRVDLYLNDGAQGFSGPSGSPLGFDGLAGASADLNGDGRDDFVVSGIDFVAGGSFYAVYLADAQSPGSFVGMPPFSSNQYLALNDVELEDIDVDGDVDIVLGGVEIGFPVPAFEDGNGGAVIVTNDGQPSPTFTVAINTPLDPDFIIPVPGGGGFSPERMGVDLIDFDLDGDLDMYLVGGDRARLAGFSSVPGALPNQFYENLTLSVDVDADGVPDLVDNCPNNPNSYQGDFDGDGLGDMCDPPGSVDPPSVILYHKPPGSTSVLIDGPLTVSSGTTIYFRAIASDPDGLGYPVFAYLGNPTLITYIWSIGDATVPEPSWYWIFNDHPPVTFTLAPGESYRRFYVTLQVFDALGNRQTEIIEVDVTL